MEPRIENTTERKLVGMRLKMSLAQNKTFALWNAFMKRQDEIKNPGAGKYSVQIYSADYFTPFSPAKEFEKWAAVEVPDFGAVPQGMETFILPGGLYAVFHHIGGHETGAETFGYIFQTWLPASGYVLDNRPHFELLGEKYKNDAPDSEEDIYIPIKPKR